MPLAVLAVHAAVQRMEWVCMTQVKSGAQGRGGGGMVDLHAASCLQLGPHHRLLTGDAAFQRVHGLNVVLLA